MKKWQGNKTGWCRKVSSRDPHEYKMKTFENENEKNKQKKKRKKKKKKEKSFLRSKKNVEMQK